MYDRFEFEPEIEEKIKEFERLAASVFAEPKKPEISLSEKAVRENWDNAKIKEACTRKSPSGTSIFMVSEYWQLVGEIDRLKRFAR